MKKFRRKIASALIVSMLAGLMSVPAYAEGVQESRWYYGELEGFDEPGWYYIKDGKLLQNQLKWINKKWYAFDEAGRMYQNEVFESPKASDESIWGDTENVRLFANPDGDLALYWIKLNPEDGTLYDGEGAFSWHYIRGQKNQDNVTEPKEMFAGMELSVNKQKYAFGRDGAMLSRQPGDDESGWARLSWGDEVTGWLVLDEDDAEYDAVDRTQQGMAYYTYEGSRAMDRALPIGDFWYYFAGKADSEKTDGELQPGMVKEIRYRVKASDSNAEPMVELATESDASAPAPTQEVVSVRAVGDTEIEGVVAGESVKVKFQVTLASDSNVEPVKNGRVFPKEYHDIFAAPSVSGDTDIQVDEKKASVTVTYTPQIPVEEAELVLYIDGIASERIHFSGKTAEAMSEGEVKATVDQLLEALVPKDGVFQDKMLSAEVVKNNISSIYTAANPEQKKTIQQSLLNSDNYDKLAEGAMMQNGAAEEVAALNEETRKALGSDRVLLKGAALEARGDAVLAVAKTDSREILPNEDAAFKKFANALAFDLCLRFDGEETNELTLPVRITMPVPAGYSAADMKLFHIHEGSEEEVSFKANGDGSISFMADRFSAYVFAQDKALEEGEEHPQGGNGGSTGGSSGGSSSGSASAGAGNAAGSITSDPKKGYVNSVTGIVTGTASGYSKWQPTLEAGGTKRWKLQYADGSYAAGSMLQHEDGSAYEQVYWELINGSWYAFGADAYAKNGFVYDVALGGSFYIDIETGMQTGWQQLDGKWYYFNPVSDGKRGIMRTDAWIDGWYVAADGIWDGKDKKQS